MPFSAKNRNASTKRLKYKTSLRKSSVRNYVHESVEQPKNKKKKN